MRGFREVREIRREADVKTNPLESWKKKMRMDMMFKDDYTPEQWMEHVNEREEELRRICRNENEVNLIMMDIMLMGR